MILSDTIAAPATPPGMGGIGIIRISGPDSLFFVSRIFRPKNPRASLKPRRMILGRVADPATLEVYDEVLAVYMPGPFSYTGEDVVEIQAHGGSGVISALVGLILGQGARLAEPGEFTMRAFRNGRMDLSQAEAVWELTQARTTFQVKAAAAQLSGAFSCALSAIRTSLEDILCLLIGSFDFPDEIAEPSSSDILSRLESEVRKPIENLVELSRKNEIARRGMNVVIAGRPNVGKSSLLNRLLGRDRAIVSNLPGTTRDSISEETFIAGRHAILWDTAGIRADAEPVESLGIERTRLALDRADVIILVIEANQPFVDQDFAILGQLEGRRLVIAANKSDLLGSPLADPFPSTHDSHPVVRVSALAGSGLDELAGALWNSVDAESSINLSQGLPNLRQRVLLERAVDALSFAISEARVQFLPDLLSTDIEAALLTLGMITGETATPDILDAIFSRFCIGK